jgi:hypothetical protein
LRESLETLSFTLAALLRPALAGELGESIQLQIAWVDSIPVSASGKHHFCLSLVSSTAGG